MLNRTLLLYLDLIKNGDQSEKVIIIIMLVLLILMCMCIIIICYCDIQISKSKRIVKELDLELMINKSMLLDNRENFLLGKEKFIKESYKNLIDDKENFLNAVNEFQAIVKSNDIEKLKRYFNENL